MSFKENINGNMKKLLDIVDNNFEGDQYDNIKLLFDHFEDMMMESPASGRPNYHNCFRGGWLDHTVRVIETSLKMKNQFVDMGVKVKSSDSDVVLAAMFHDLGKLGDMNNSYYIIQTDDWRRNKLNEFYTYNDKLEPMSVTDRSLWILQKFKITLTDDVWKAIKMSDGMFDAGNEQLYRMSTDSKNILHYIVHFGDWMATVAEKQHYLQSLDCNDDDDESVSNLDDSNLNELKSKFDELFTA